VRVSELVGRAASNSKIPKQSQFNYLLIAQIGWKLLEKCTNLTGFSAADEAYTARRMITRTADKSLIPSALACKSACSKGSE